MHCIVANWNGTYKKWMSGQPHRGHLAALAGWPARFFHHFSFTTFLKVKCYKKLPAYISCTKGLISNELPYFRK